MSKSKTPSGKSRPTVNQIVRGVFQIKPADVKRIITSKPGKSKPK